MYRYVVLVNWTDQGIRNVKQTQSVPTTAVRSPRNAG